MENCRLIGRLFATLSFNDPNDRFYDVQLDHWGIRREKNSAGRRESFAEMRERLETWIYQGQPGPVRQWLDSDHNGIYDNTIAGVGQLNDSTIPTSDNVYYFSLSFSCVQQFPNNWPPWTLDAIRSFPLSIAEFLASFPITGNIAQLLIDTLGQFLFLTS